MDDDIEYLLPCIVSPVVYKDIQVTVKKAVDRTLGGGREA